MGCANAKPEAHTKKPPLNSNSNMNPSQIEQPVQNPIIKPQPIPTVKQNISTGKENIVPIQKPNWNTQTQKSNLSDIQKNPYLTREQVKQEIAYKQQQQFKNPFQPMQVQEITKTDNIQLQKSPQVQQQKLQEIKPASVQAKIDYSPVRQKLMKSDEKPGVLSTIKEGKQQSQFTKQIQPSFLAVEKRENLRASESIFSSGTPRMGQQCMVSKISRPTQSPLRPIYEEQKGLSQSQVKIEPKIQALRYKEVQKQNGSIAEKNPESLLKEKGQIEILRKSQLGNSNISKKSDENEKNINNRSESKIGKQNNQLTTDEIKIQVMSEKKEVQYHQIEQELEIPTEQNFDLRCSFQINNLIIDMNQIVW